MGLAFAKNGISSQFLNIDIRILYVTLMSVNLDFRCVTLTIIIYHPSLSPGRDLGAQMDALVHVVSFVAKGVWIFLVFSCIPLFFETTPRRFVSSGDAFIQREHPCHDSLARGTGCMGPADQCIDSIRHLSSMCLTFGVSDLQVSSKPHHFNNWLCVYIYIAEQQQHNYGLLCLYSLGLFTQDLETYYN